MEPTVVERLLAIIEGICQCLADPSRDGRPPGCFAAPVLWLVRVRLNRIAAAVTKIAA